MKKIIFGIMCIWVFTFQIFAGGKAESGRGNASDDVNQGQLLQIGTVDPASYLQDFAFEKTNTSGYPLKFDVELLKDSIWEKGEDISLRIDLISNARSFFKSVPGKYILYFQNPEILRNKTVSEYLENEMTVNKTLDYYMFEPIEGKLLGTDTEKELADSIAVLAGQPKQYANNIGLIRLLKVIEAELSNDRVHVIWVTDENIIEKSSDASFFEFAMNVFSTGKTTFSYLGYGEVPNWTVLNAGLMRLNGNSWYAKTEHEVCEKIGSDISFFAKPAIEDIRIEIVWSRYVQELANYYPADSYSQIYGFYPTTNNSRPLTVHNIGGMNYSESRRLIHYLKIPAVQTLIESSEGKYPESGGKYRIGTVYVKYYVPMFDREFYEQKELIISYKDSSENSSEYNKYVYADTIIQNTPLIIQEIANLVNRKYNYLTAIQLVKTQKSLLQSVSAVREDKAIAEDIALLNKYYDLLFTQAQTMNLLQ